MKKLTTISAFTLGVLLIGGGGIQAQASAYAAERASVIGGELSNAMRQDLGESYSVMVSVEDVDFTAHPEILDLRKTISESGDSMSADEMQEAIMEYRRACSELYSVHNAEYVQDNLRGYDIEYVSHYLPMVFTELTEREVYDLSLNPSVEAMELAEDFVEIPVNDNTSNNITYEGLFSSAKLSNYSFRNMIHSSEVSDLGYTGNGVKVGIWESGVPMTSCWSHLGIDTNHCYAGEAAELGYTTHSTEVASIIKQVAPSVELFCATGSRDSVQNAENLEWLISKGVNVINASYAASGALGYLSSSAFFDALTSKYFVTMIAAVGNQVKDHSIQYISATAMAYNSIAVGNVDISGNVYSTGVETGSSCYTLMSNTNCAYRPDLCAPGVDIFSSLSYDPVYISGTSFSAPFTTGAVALLMQASPNLMVAPDTIKAVLAASVNESYGAYHYSRYQPTFENSGYEVYGAGIIDCYHAYQTIMSDNYEYDSFSTNGEIATKTVSLQSGESLRVSMAFLYNASYEVVTKVYGSNKTRKIVQVTNSTLPDFDIELLNSSGSIVASSRTTNNSLEILEYNVSSTGTYTIRIRCVAASEDDTFYGYAWTIY